ncbi:MAG: alpha/beta hydrolase [Polymorphobacter sp.]
MTAAPATGLARRRTLPAGGTCEMRPMRDGWPVRTLFWPGAADGPGSILFLTGRGDFAEKYCEAFHDLVDAGWGVATFDWRGQGLSGRQGITPMHGHSPGFENWLGDLDELIDWFHAVLPAPWYGVAHSMGGHLMQRHLAGENAEFTRVVLLSPMLGVSARPLGPWLAARLARLMTALGRGGQYVPGGGPHVKHQSGSIRQRLLTHDPDRYGDEDWWVQQDQARAIGSVTYGWLDAAFQSLAAIFAPPPGARGTGEGADARPALQRITTPMLILIPEQDGLVDNDVTRRARALMPYARVEEFAGAGHELLREADPLRARVLARMLAFLGTGA